MYYLGEKEIIVCDQPNHHFKTVNVLYGFLRSCTTIQKETEKQETETETKTETETETERDTERDRDR